jgi:hypothetical protein
MGKNDAHLGKSPFNTVDLTTYLDDYLSGNYYLLILFMAKLVICKNSMLFGIHD